MNTNDNIVLPPFAAHNETIAKPVIVKPVPIDNVEIESLIIIKLNG